MNVGRYGAHECGERLYKRFKSQSEIGTTEEKMNRYIIAGNWKMNMKKVEIRDFFDKVSGVSNIENSSFITKIVCPVFPMIPYAMEMSENTSIIIGSQNVSEHEKGAFTGEVSASILNSIEVTYCIIGHSERRQYFKETDAAVKQKWLQLRAEKINPIICVGETLSERESGKTFNVIKKQIEGIFKGVDIEAGEDLMIAYEPVWAIGTGKTATPEIAQEVHAYIRKLLTNIYGECSKNIPLLYGGSVKSSNVKDLLSQADINGALVGGASLDPNEYASLVKYAGELIVND